MFFFRRQIDAPFSQDLMDRLFDCDRPKHFEFAEIVDVQDINYNNVIARNSVLPLADMTTSKKATKQSRMFPYHSGLPRSLCSLAMTKKRTSPHPLFDNEQTKDEVFS